MRPEQWGESTEIFGGEDAGRFGFGEGSWIMSVLTYTRGGLEDVQGEHPELLLVAAFAGEFAAFAVEDHGVDAVPSFDQV